MNIKWIRKASLLSGLITVFPGGNQWLSNRSNARRPEGGTSTARYCYSVWLRHLVLANQAGVIEGIPKNVAEIGPGKSLGTGLAALLSGADRYHAFDVVRYVAEEKNIKIFDDLISLFSERSDIPDSEEYPSIVTKLDSYEFPGHILTDEVMAAALNPARTTKIRNELIGCGETTAPHISYIVPWNDTSIIAPESIDMIFSMSVMEHIDDPESAYRTAYGWLRKGAFMSHEVDLTCHGHSVRWNGHWAYPKLAWKIARGKRPYIINRWPHSAHTKTIEGLGFDIVTNTSTKDSSGLNANELAKQFRSLSQADCETSNAFILARRQ